MRMWDNSPLLGMGIKDYIEGSIYPYGSHSTYLGYFYKIGILGGFIYLLSFVVILYRLIKLNNNKFSDYLRVISAFCVLLWMILEDIDGANWAICIFYSVLGQIKNIYRRYNNEQNT